MYLPAWLLWAAYGLQLTDIGFWPEKTHALHLVYTEQVLICRRHTRDISAGTAWGTVTPYLNIYWRIKICTQACEVELSSTSQASRLLSAMKISSEHHLRTQHTPASKTIRFIFTGEKLKIGPIRLAFRANLSTSAIYRRCAEDPLGRAQIAERCH